MQVQIKEWFISKKLTELGQAKAYAVKVSIMGGESFIEKETEKAVLVNFPNDFGKISFWVPKSCLVN